MSILSDYHYRFLNTLLKHNVKFLVVGGQAAIYHGVRRGTGDLDILVEPTIANGKNILLAFSDLELSADEISPKEFTEQLFLGLGFEPDAVDLFNMTPGIQFNEAFANSHQVEERDIIIPIISPQDLLKNKESLNRQGEKNLIDQFDILVLKKLMNK